LKTKEKHCKKCDGFGHSAINCFRNPKATIKVTKGLKKTGSYTMRMQTIRRKWFKQNPSNQGYYYCIYCGKAVTRDPDLLAMGVERVELDHIHSRSRYPELRFELTNLAPSCHNCNTEKGSKEKKGLFK
jgi:5-methylcytosine-specific restriction endonuclease McrA